MTQSVGAHGQGLDEWRRCVDIGTRIPAVRVLSSDHWELLRRHRYYIYLLLYALKDGACGVLIQYCNSLKTMLTILACVSSLLALQVRAATVICATTERTDLNTPLDCLNHTLQSDGVEPSIFIIDYGQNIEGRPTFVLDPMAGTPLRLNVAYSESRAALDLPNVSLRPSITKFGAGLTHLK